MTQNNEDNVLKSAFSEILGYKETTTQEQPKDSPEGTTDPSKANPAAAPTAEGAGSSEPPKADEQSGDGQQQQQPTAPDPTSGAVTEADVFKRHFSDLGVESIEQAKSLIQSSGELLKAYDDLKLEFDKLKTTPQFSDENDRRVFDWVKQYRVQDARAFNEHRMIDEIDLDKVDGRTAMRLDYILSKKTIPLEDAIKRFEYEYPKRYEPDEMASDDEKEMVRIDKMEAENQARENLRNLKQKYGTVEKPQETPEQKAAAMALDRSVGESLSGYESSIKSKTEHVFKHGAAEYRIEIGEKERDTLDKIIKPILQNRANYGQDGKLAINVDWMVDREMKIILWDKLVEKIETEMGNKAKDLAMQTVINRQPDITKSGGASGVPTVTTVDNMASAIDKAFK